VCVGFARMQGLPQPVRLHQELPARAGFTLSCISRVEQMRTEELGMANRHGAGPRIAARRVRGARDAAPRSTSPWLASTAARSSVRDMNRREPRVPLPDPPPRGEGRASRSPPVRAVRRKG
jgi:hypothetical protein